MLIPFGKLVSSYNIREGHILHIGAHHCEERADYAAHGFDDGRVLWLEGNPDIVSEVKARSPSVSIHQALVSNCTEQVDFIVTNNGQSSSILELDEHKKEHPWVVETHRKRLTTTTVDSFLHQQGIDPSLFRFVNIDIQGAELYALQGMRNVLPHIQFAYLEVNTKHLYKGCPLLEELDNFMVLNGFVRKELVMTEHGWGDAFYVRDGA